MITHAGFLILMHHLIHYTDLPVKGRIITVIMGCLPVDLSCYHLGPNKLSALYACDDGKEEALNHTPSFTRKKLMKVAIAKYQIAKL